LERWYKHPADALDFSRMRIMNVSFLNFKHKSVFTGMAFSPTTAPLTATLF
jgi:hypothetical protein